MPRNSSPHQPEGESLSPKDARIKLQRCIDKGRELSQKQPFSEERYSVWYTNTFKALEEIFGKNSGHLYTFKGQPRISVSWNPQNYQANENQKRLLKEIDILEALIEELPESDDQDQSTRSDFFSDLDTDTREKRYLADLVRYLTSPEIQKKHALDLGLFQRSLRANTETEWAEELITPRLKGKLSNNPNVEPRAWSQEWQFQADHEQRIGQ